MKSTDDIGLFTALIAESAASGNVATVPATQSTAGDGTASIALGFPPETFIDRSAGGKPPRGQDMNGFLNRLSKAVQALQAGYFGQFNSALAASIGGYPSGSIVSGSVAGTFWVSTSDNNTSVPGDDGETWQSLFFGLLTPSTADARYVRGIWNTTTDQRILSIARNKTDSGIYVQLDNNTSQRLQLFGDYATNTALTAETNRAATVESNLQSSKVNRDGDTLTGTLNINVPGVGVLLSGNGGGDNVPGGISYAAGVQSSPSVGATPKAIYRFINVNGVGSFATIWLTGNDGSPHELRFGADDRLRTASGNVFALTSELPLPEGMHAQIFVTSIPAGTPCGPGQEGCLVTLPIAFSSIAVVQVCNSGQNVYTISGIGVGGSQVRLWVQSPQHLSGTLVEYVNVNLNVYGYR